MANEILLQVYPDHRFASHGQSLLITDRAGAINGGLYKKPEDPMGQHPSVVVSVENMEEAMAKVGEAGGKVVGEPMDIPGVGKYVSFIDTEGNRMSMLQPAANR